jgi:hypothetical protein
MLLMPLNWSLESLKIYQKFNLNYSFKECVWITLKGLGLSLVTPMGMGVFVGRAMFEDQARRENLLTATAFSSYAQSMVTFSIGMFAFYKFCRLLGIIIFVAFPSATFSNVSIPFNAITS